MIDFLNSIETYVRFQIRLGQRDKL